MLKTHSTNHKTTREKTLLYQTTIKSHTANYLTVKTTNLTNMNAQKADNQPHHSETT